MILRSAFWLAVGFAFVAPHGTDFGATATSVRDQAASAGARAVAQIIASQVFDPTPTLPGKPASSVQSVGHPTQDAPASAFAFPRPRPAAMG